MVGSAQNGGRVMTALQAGILKSLEAPTSSTALTSDATPDRGRSKCIRSSGVALCPGP